MSVSSASGALPLVDVVLKNGHITTFAGPQEGPSEVSGLAIAQNRIVAVGSDEEMKPYEALATRVIDLEGRRAVPGLNDSHIHAMRAGISWNRVVHWEDVSDLNDGLERIRTDAQSRGAGQWVGVVGGWHQTQMHQRRGPTREELDEVAPHNPVVVQELYDRAVLNSAALAACEFRDDSPNPARGKLLRDENGRLTGEIRGAGAFAIPLGKLLRFDAEEARAGIRQMCTTFAEHGLTGVVDAGGLLVTPSDYDPLYDVWRSGDLDLRTRLFISAWTRGAEVKDIEQLTTLVQPESGDGMLRIAGVGEIPHLGCHDMEGLDEFHLSDASHAELIEIMRMCALRGWRMSIHAVLDYTLNRILDAWEQVEAETGLVAHRGNSIVHADEASPKTLERIAKLGIGVLVQSRLVLKGEDYVENWGVEATKNAPPIADMRELGITIGGGTDSTRANWFSPWTAIWWLVTGQSLNGVGNREQRHCLSIEDAIASYTRDAAWFTGETAERGKLLPGYDADVCVPTRDPFSCPPDELRDIRSVLTITNGRITHEALDVKPTETRKTGDRF